MAVQCYKMSVDLRVFVLNTSSEKKSTRKESWFIARCLAGGIVKR